MRLRRVVVLLPLTALLYSAVGHAAPTAVTVGQAAATPAQTTGCGPDAVFFQDTVGGGTPTYTVPSAGVITSWSVMGDVSLAAKVQLKVGLEAPDNVYTITGSSVPKQLTPSTLNTFTSRIPVTAGDRLGLRVPVGAIAPCGVLTGNAADTIRYIGGTGPDPALGSTYATNTASATVRVNVSANVEPDVDNDGFGDVTQDLCPTVTSSQGDCVAPDTGFGKVKKTVKTKAQKARVSIPLTATEAGATFTCSVDGKKPAPCTSPFKVTLKIGTHVVYVTSTDAAGNSDKTAATIKITVKKKA